MALVGAILVSSLLGSPHCAAMCGGFSCFYTAPAGGRRYLALVAYNGGRLGSYVVLGAVAGALGAGVNAVGWMEGVARPAALAAGVLMVIWGMVTILRALGARLPQLSPPGAARRVLAGVLQRMQQRPPVARAAVLGLLTTLLPCGWLYVFVATAGGTGSAWQGGLVMAAFWLGTVPMMAGLGLAVQRVSGPLRRRLPVITAAVMVVIGLLTAAGRLGMSPGASAPGAVVHDHR